MPSAVAAMFVFCLFAAGLAAQDPEPDPSRVIGEAIERQLLLEVESRLRSDELTTVAWGAHLAARHGVSSAVPALRRRLASLAEVDEKERRFAVLALLDALQVNAARLATEELQPFCRGAMEPVAFVLASRDPDQHRDFLFGRFAEHDEKGRQTRWLASGQLLAALGDREFGRQLVRSLRYRLKVTVLDDKSTFGGGMGGAIGGRFGDGVLTVPAGYPPTAIYGLVLRPKPGDVLLTGGERPVYWRREVRAGRRVGIGTSEGLLREGRQDVRAAWLAEMLELYVLKLPRQTDETHRFEDADGYRRAVNGWRRGIAAQHERVLKAAEERGWFTDEERAALPAEVELVVDDQRGDRGVALPDVD